MYRVNDRPVGVCPSCRRGLVRVQHAGHWFERCPGCEGVWLDEATLTAMWSEMSADAPPLALDDRESERAPRACPTCGDPLAPVALFSIPLDRCGVDGIWFDWPELQVALARASLPDDDWHWRFARWLQAMR